MSSNNPPKFIDARRRGFLQGAAVVTGAAATGAVGAAVEPATPAEPVTTDDRSGDAGYRLTDKVREYYARARF